MKYWVITDSEDTLNGLRLAGIEGVIAQTRDAVHSALNDAATRPDVGILLIGERCAALCPEPVNDMKLNLHAPLLVEIPDRDGTGRAPDSITRYIRESIGVKL